MEINVIELTYYDGTIFKWFTSTPMNILKKGKVICPSCIRIPHETSTTRDLSILFFNLKIGEKLEIVNLPSKKYNIRKPTIKEYFKLLQSMKSCSYKFNKKKNPHTIIYET